MTTANGCHNKQMEQIQTITTKVTIHVIRVCFVSQLHTYVTCTHQPPPSLSLFGGYKQTIHVIYTCLVCFEGGCKGRFVTG